jgi:hypothetical protein
MSQQSAPRDTPLIAQCALRCHSHTFLVPAMPGTGRDRLELPDDGKAGHGLHTACLSPPSCACASRRVVQRRRRTGVNSKRSSSPGKVRLRRHYALQSVIGRQRVNASGSEKLTIRPLHRLCVRPAFVLTAGYPEFTFFVEYELSSVAMPRLGKVKLNLLPDPRADTTQSLP